MVWECEQPAASDNRGYDMDAQAAHDTESAGRHAARPLNGIPPGERYRASRMHSTAGQYGKAEILGDYGSRLLARQACEQAAGQLLAWRTCRWRAWRGPRCGRAGAEVIYGTLDRYAKAAAGHDEKAA